MDKTAVILLAHGSKKDNWNPAVMDLYRDLKNNEIIKNLEIGFFDVAFLQYKPHLHEVVNKLKEDYKVSKIFVIPLFITHSVHVLYDIPVLLNLSYYPEKYDELIYDKNYPIPEVYHATLAPTLSHGNFIEDIMYERVMEKSESPENESVILVSHGSDIFKGSWDEILKACKSKLKENNKFHSIEFEYIEAGQTFMNKAFPMIKEKVSQNKRVIIAGLYLVNSSSDIYRRFGNNKNDELNALVNSGKVVFSDKGLLPHDHVKKWIIDMIVKYKEKSEIKDMFI